MNKKKVVWFLSLLTLVLVVASLLQSKQKIKEGFEDIRYPLQLQPQSGNIVVYSRQGSGGSVLWMLGPPTMPDAIFNSVRGALDKQRKIEDMYTNPGNYIRLHWKTHIPYTDVNMNTITSSTGNNCEPEFELKEINSQPYAKGFKYFSTKPEIFINNIRGKCNIQVTPQMLGTLPKAVQEKWVEAIFGMQKNLIDIKRLRIKDGGGNCKTRREFADNLFSPEMRTAHENRIARERQQLQVDTLTNIKKDANSTLNDIANATGSSASKILDNPAARSAIKGQLQQPTSNITKAVYGQLRPSPYAVVNTALKAAGIDILTDSFKAIVKVLSGDPFAGTECPAGFTEIDQINTDPTFQKMNDIFPNPFSDLINIGATTKACAKYESGKPPVVQQKMCRVEYVDEPTRLVPIQQTPPTPSCDMDKDITKKLKLVSDWVTQYTIKNSSEVKTIENFTYVWAPSEYFLEAIFTVSNYSKNTTQKKDPYGRLQKIPDPDKREARFYFTKSGCSYDVFGYYDRNLDFLYQFKVNQGTPINYSPPPSNDLLLWIYAQETGVKDPIAYVTQNASSASVLNMIKAKNDERNAKEAVDKKETDDLLKFLNPSNNPEIAYSLRNASLPELRERKQIFELYPSLNRTTPYTIDLLRKVASIQKEKAEIIALFNPDKNPQVQSIFENMTMDWLTLMKNSGKQARDNAMNILNPTKTLAKRLELERLQTGELEAQVREKQNRDLILASLNPSNNPQTATILNQLSTNELNSRYAKWNERKEFIKYFNPSDSESILTRLLNIPVNELNERMTLVKALNPKNNEEIQSLNLLTLDALRTRANELNKPMNDIKAFFNPDNYSSIDIEIAKYPLELLQERMRLLKKLQEKNKGIRAVDFMQFSNVPSKYPNSRIKTDYSFLNINWDA